MSRSSSRRHLRLLISAVLWSVLAACGGPSRQIVGKWRTSSDPNSVVWEFADNGLVTIGSTRARYSSGDAGRIKLQTPFDMSVYQLTTLHDYMTFLKSNGSKFQ